MIRRRWLLLGLLNLILLSFIGLPGQAQDLPPCGARPGWFFQPRVDAVFFCYETVLHAPAAGEFAFTALEFAPDGRLFATRPLTGEVFVLEDADGDGLPEQPRRIAAGLTLPNALAYHAGALYIAGGAHVYRLDAAGTLTTLVADLPSGTGFWTGGLAVYQDRLIVGIGAPCEACAWDDPARGVLLSLALDGSDQQIMARGLRYPAALGVIGDALYVGDSVSPPLAHPAAQDELNRVVSGAHYGYPYCEGATNTPTTLPSRFDCAQATAPALTIARTSNPIDLALYEGAAFPHLRGHVLLALAGSLRNPLPQGYMILALPWPEDTAALAGQPVTAILPQDPLFRAQFGASVYDPALGLTDASAAFVNLRGAGLYPHRLYSLAISPEGWIYFSSGGGTIGVLRPQ